MAEIPSGQNEYFVPSRPGGIIMREVIETDIT
jgi:hypothetical protein